METSNKSLSTFIIVFSFLNNTVFIHFICRILFVSKCTIFLFAGDQVRRGRLQTSHPHGLPGRPSYAHAGLLAERSQRKTQILPDRHSPGQADPEPGEPQVNGHVVQVRAPRSITLPLEGFTRQMYFAVVRYDPLKSPAKLTRKFGPSAREHGGSL